MEVRSDLMRVLVTGGLGFIGSEVVRQLLKTKANVLNVDKITYAANFKNLDGFENFANYRFLECDIVNSELITKAMKQFKPDLIIHLAAESHVDNSINNPVSLYSSNVEGTLCMLECARQYRKDNGLDLFVHVSTDEVYGALGLEGYFTEESNYAPNSPYSASKAASDHLVRAWSKTYNLPTVITNCSNNFGPNQHR